VARLRDRYVSSRTCARGPTALRECFGRLTRGLDAKPLDLSRQRLYRDPYLAPLPAPETARLAKNDSFARHKIHRAAHQKDIAIGIRQQKGLPVYTAIGVVELKPSFQFGVIDSSEAAQSSAEATWTLPQKEIGQSANA